MSSSPTARHRHLADDILERACELFDSKGYGDTSLQDIADAVGIARPSIYHYFASKEAILVTIVEGAISTRDDIIADVRTSEAAPDERLRSLLTRVGASTAHNPAGLRLVLNASAALPNDLRRRDVASRRAMFELMSEVLGVGIDAGLFRPADERATAATIIAALTGLQYRDIGGVSMTPDEATANLVDALLDGVTRARPGGASAAATIASIREDLDALSRQLDER